MYLVHPNPIMDSARTNILEEQSSQKKNTQKPFIFSSIILLTLIVAGILTVTTIIITRQVSQYSQHSYTYHAPTYSQSIRDICSFTPYKRLCRSALSSSVSAARTNISGSDYPSPETIIFLSFQLSVTQLTRLASLVNFSKPNEAPDVVSALHECQVLLNKEVSQLNKEVSQLNKEVSQLNNSEASRMSLYSFIHEDANGYVERFNRMETHQQACLDKLEISGSTVIDEVRLNVQTATSYMNNTKAIFLNIDPILEKIYGSHSVDVDYYSYDYFFGWWDFHYMIVFVSQYIFLILLLILMIKN